MPPDPLITRMVEALGQAPEAHLRIFDLARDLLRPDGSVDARKAQRRLGELQAARQQAEAYAAETKAVLDTLARLARGQPL